MELIKIKIKEKYISFFKLNDAQPNIIIISSINLEKILTSYIKDKFIQEDIKVLLKRNDYYYMGVKIIGTDSFIKDDVLIY